VTRERRGSDQPGESHRCLDKPGLSNDLYVAISGFDAKVRSRGRATVPQCNIARLSSVADRQHSIFTSELIKGVYELGNGQWAKLERFFSLN
jgi:hypothetical protein